MKDIEKRLDGVFERFSKGQEGDAHANNSGLIALAYGLAHLGDKLEKAANAYLKAAEGSKGVKAPEGPAQ